MKKKACAVEKVKDPNNFASTIATNHSSRRVRCLLVDLIAIRYLFFRRGLIWRRNQSGMGLG